MSVKLYVEGGGKDKFLRIACREGFRTLLERAGFRGKMPSIKACGSRDDAFDDFKTALYSAGVDFPILLVDSERAVVQGANSWQHLATAPDKWAKPAGAAEDQAHLMVQCMETWLVADRLALKKFFGKDFKERSLPNNTKLETVSKDDVQKSLAEASQPCKTKYKKGQTSFELLATIDPAALKSLPHFQRLYETLDAKLS